MGVAESMPNVAFTSSSRATTLVVTDSTLDAGRSWNSTVSSPISTRCHLNRGSLYSTVALGVSTVFPAVSVIS